MGPLGPLPHAGAAGPAAFVDLGSAASYSVLAGAGVSNTGEDTVLALDLGLSPTGAIAGFPPGIVTGTTHDKDSAAEAAQEDREAAYAAAAAQPGGTPFAGDQAGVTFKPGVHTSAAAFTNTGTMTLDADGDSSAVFVFQIGAALSSAAASKVVLTDGALANNVYWQVVGAVSLGAGARYVGTFLAAGVVSFGEGASLKGRILTPGTVALANSPVTRPIDDLTAPVVTLAGGPVRSTNDTTPAISGTTDESAGSPVSVTVGSQTLTTQVGAAGAWSVSAAALPEGPHTVTASVTDASRNTGTATQVLTVDTTVPVVTIDGGAQLATNDTSPVISGTTDEPAGSSVTVEAAGQRLTTTSGAGGVWTVTADALAETAHGVVASIVDAAGSTGSATQVLTVDLTKPVVTIDGGASRATNDSSPWTYGATGEKAGTGVVVAVGGQLLTATVTSAGTWGVSATTLPEGAHQLVASITDAAGNTGTAPQLLAVGTAPVVPVVPVVPPEPKPRYQPDGAIRGAKGPFVGAGRYGSSREQRTTARVVRARSATFSARLTNDGDSQDRLAVRGTSRSKRFAVTYRLGGRNVTSEIVSGTFRTASLAPGESVVLAIKITRTGASRRGDRRVFEVRATSSHPSLERDAVAAVVRR
ncbi:hypothetical protein GCM10023350_47050 [Nocardioides endophyticus]|uniref:Bacterial Ig-like domain-containing protein n=1 Tax=Nocardioides endophyticus TaxID=1353775 RepID=A0ABP8ZGY9_9ACTN